MTDLDRFSRPLWGERKQQISLEEVNTTMDGAAETTIRSQQELFERFRRSLAPEIKRDIDHYLFLYDMFLDEPDPKARGTILGEMKLLEKKYHLEVEHESIEAN